MKNISIKPIVSDAFIKNVLQLLSGNLFVQIVNILSAPILSRIFSIEEFGIYTVFTTINAVCSVIVNLQYDQAIIIESDNRNAIILVKLCTYISFVVLLPLGILVHIYVGTTQIASYSNFYYTFTFLSLSTCLMVGISIPRIRLLIRNKKYSHVSFSYITQSLSYLLSVLFFKTIVGVQHSMIYGFAMSEFLQTVYLTIATRGIVASSLRRISAREIKEMFQKHIGFPKFLIVSNLLNSSSDNMPGLVLSNLSGMETAGLYGMAYKIAALPFSIMSMSVSSIYLQTASTAISENDTDRLREITRSTSKKLVYISVLPMSALLVFGDLLFSVFLGTHWQQAGVIAQYMALWMVFTFITSPLSGVFNALNKHHIRLIISITLLVSRITALVIGFLIFHDVMIAIALFSIFSACVWIVANYYIMKYTDVPIYELIGKFIIVYGIVILVFVLIRLAFIKGI